MTLDSPLALALLAVAAPIVWFFLRRPPAPVRAVSSLLLARALAKVPKRRKKLPREDILPLALMLGALLVGVAALALSPGAPRDHLVVVLDDSDQSPLAADPAQARAALANLLAQHHPSRTTVVATAPPRLLFAGDTHPEQLLALLDRPGGGSSGDPSALLAALCRPPRHTPAVLALTHQPLDGLPADCPVLRPALSEPPAQAVLALTASSPTGTGDGWLHARVLTQDNAEWTVLADDQPLGSLTASPGADGIAELLGRVTAPPGARLRLAPADGAAGVDSTVTLPPLARARTLVRTEHPEGYLATLARLHPRVDAVVLPPGAPAPAERADLLLTAAAAPITDDAAVVVVFGRGAPELGIPAAGRLRAPELLTGSAPDSQVLELVGLETLHATEATVLAVPADATVLTTTRQGPVAATRPVDEDTLAVVLGVGLQHSDLALRTAFVHLVANLVDIASPSPPPPPPAPTRPALAAIGAASADLELATPVWRWLVGLVGLLLVGEAVLQLVGRRSP
mgnify:FL=1